MSRELIERLAANAEEGNRKTAALIEQQAAEIERLQRWRSTNAPRLEALEGLLHTAQHELHGAREAVATLASERDANAILTAEVEALRKNAERYQRLRSHHHIPDAGDGWLFLAFDCGEAYKEMTAEERGAALDAAIDAAMSTREGA